MKMKIFMLLILVSIVAISGCADYGGSEDSDPLDEGEETTSDETADEEMDTQIPEPDSAAIFSEITDVDSYSEWSIWPGKEAMEEGTGVHGEYVTVYVSDNALPAAETGEETMPDGTMVVKEGFNGDEELTGIYLMYKVEGYDPENNDWFWAAYSPEGNINAEGKVDGCINCHEREQDADYLFFNT